MSQRWQDPQPAPRPDPSRRRLLRLAAGLGLGAWITGCRRGIVLEDLSQLDELEDQDLATEIARQATAAVGPSPNPAPSDTPFPTPDPRALGFDTDLRLTPADRFYVMKYGEIQDLDRAAWRLHIDGLAPRPTTLRFSDLDALPARSFLRTLACISNPAGGDLIGNAAWTGAPFAEILALAGIPGDLEAYDTSATALASSTPGSEDGPSGWFLRLEGADGYHTGIPLSLALDPRSYLVYAMNGRPLLPKHGYPARCLFPGRFGQKQPKWLTRISLQDEPHIGHWEGQGWSDSAEIVISSRLDSPRQRATVEAPVLISGIAFAGLSGVAEVELIIDDRQRVQAELAKAPEPFADLCWTEWRYLWTDPSPGNHKILARARDGAGLGQSRAREHVLDETFPDGSTTMDRLDITVAGA